MQLIIMLDHLRIYDENDKEFVYFDSNNYYYQERENNKTLLLDFDEGGRSRAGFGYMVDDNRDSHEEYTIEDDGSIIYQIRCSECYFLFDVTVYGYGSTLEEAKKHCYNNRRYFSEFYKKHRELNEKIHQEK